MLIVSALYGARSQEFHSSRHMCCDDVTIKKSDLICDLILDILAPLNTFKCLLQTVLKETYNCLS